MTLYVFFELMHTFSRTLTSSHSSPVFFSVTFLSLTFTAVVDNCSQERRSVCLSSAVRPSSRTRQSVTLCTRSTYDWCSRRQVVMMEYCFTMPTTRQGSATLSRSASETNTSYSSSTLEQVCNFIIISSLPSCMVNKVEYNSATSSLFGAQTPSTYSQGNMGKF